ncbi:hypothetical protein BH11PSE13_BH11PSE13_45820 [soil metagenome]
MATNNRSQGPTARLLGYAGLVPFVVGAAWAWATRATPTGATASFALAAYAATIVAFLGGVHWGPALREGGRDLSALGWGVLAQLAAWLALLLPTHTALLVLAGLLALCFVLDYRLYARAGLAEWLPLRLRLTCGAVASCLLAAAA